MYQNYVKIKFYSFVKFLTTNTYVKAIAYITVLKVTSTIVL